MSDLTDDHWHLDKRVPVALIIILTFQLIGAVWSFATLTSKVDVNSVNIARVEKDFNNRADRHDFDASQRNSRIMDVLNRIEDKLDRKVDK